MPNLILWCKRNNFNFYGTTLIEPSEQKVTCLPKEAKQDIIKLYKKFTNDYKKLLTRHDIEQIKSWLSFMVSTDDSYLLSTFKKEQERLDSLRNESFIKTFPEFTSWYETI
jgi:hypothetical protein|tara:strand:- start:184 stop:516 length:333 start_codon:yes stop_codon:yes gene_type:complete